MKTLAIVTAFLVSSEGSIRFPAVLTEREAPEAGGNESVEQPGEGGPPTVTNQAEPLNPTPGGGSKVHSGPAGQVGNVTSPFANKKMLNLEKLSESVLLRGKKLNIPQFELKKLKEKKDDTNIKVASKIVKKQIDLSFQIPQEPSTPE